jgi:uncharacterized protein (DUF362 family)
MAVISISKNNDIRASIKDSLSRLDLINVFRGRQVAVKPNETWASDNDKTAVTQPEVLEAVLEFLKSMGPKELVVTGGAGAGETDENHGNLRDDGGG